jgi:hypothetical protein
MKVMDEKARSSSILLLTCGDRRFGSSDIVEMSMKLGALWLCFRRKRAGLIEAGTSWVST